MHTERLSLWLWLLALAAVAIAYRLLFVGTRSLATAGWPGVTGLAPVRDRNGHGQTHR